MDAVQEKEVRRSGNGGRKNGCRIAAALILLCYALLGWLRFYNAIKYQQYFLELMIWPSPRYIMLSGLAIGTTFSLVLLSVLIRAGITPIVARIVGFLFLGWLWVDHVRLGTREAFPSQISVNILITVVTLLLILVLIRNRDYYGEKIEELKNGD
jgi:hypothetical protein